MSSTPLSPPEGSRKKRKRVGRGPGSGRGKTSTRGHKGQGARSGSKKRPWFEGGQMPLQRRVPKGGFTPLRRTLYQVVNLATLAKADKGATLTPAELAAKGWIKNPHGLVKVLGEGDLALPLHLHAHRFSQSAVEKITRAGGTATIIPRGAQADAAETGPASGNEN